MKPKEKKKTSVLAALLPLLLLSSCATKYKVTGVERTRILIDSRYDTPHDTGLEAYLAPYKAQVDSIMSPVVGSIARNTAAKRPESELSNLLADILVWGSKRFNETPDFAVYNMGGIRAAFTKGAVTKGDVLNVAPFVNKLCVVSLTGAKTKELFEQMASTGGEGVSGGVRLVITRDGRLKSALVGGEEIDPERTYRIATLDYLANGNDKLEAFKDKTNVVMSHEESNNVRFIIEEYFQELAAEGKAADSKVEGRIIVE